MSFAEDRRRDALVRYRKNREELSDLASAGVLAIFAIYFCWHLYRWSQVGWEIVG